MEVNQLPPQFIGRNGTPVAGIIMCVYVDVRMGKREGREEQKAAERLRLWERISDGLPCRFALLTMLGWGTAHVCRMRVWEMLAESISWAAEREGGREGGEKKIEGLSFS